MTRDFKGIWISPEILTNKQLSFQEQFYLAIYEQFDKNLIYADSIALEGGMSKITIRRCKNKLIKLGLISKEYTPQDIKKMTIEMCGTGDKCEWCGNLSPILHEHHYPIPKHKGGIDKVHICPNCHYTYHKLMLYYEENLNK